MSELHSTENALPNDDVVLVFEIDICPITAEKNKDENFFKLFRQLKTLFNIRTDITWKINSIMEEHYKTTNCVFIVEVANYHKEIKQETAMRTGRVVSLDTAWFEEYFEVPRNEAVYVFVSKPTFQQIVNKYF